MESRELGKVYKNAEIIVQQGDPGDCIYVVQEGLVEVVSETEHGEVQLALLSKGAIFGEMAIFDREVRSATVRAIGSARVLTIEKKNFLRRIYEDRSLAFHLVETMSARIRELDNQMSMLQLQLDNHPN